MVHAGPGYCFSPYLVAGSWCHLSLYLFAAQIRQRAHIRPFEGPSHAVYGQHEIDGCVSNTRATCQRRATPPGANT
jgi:hypothetical protein